MNRARLHFTLIALLVIAVGLGVRSRCFPQGFFSKYVGDALWAVVVYLMFRWIFPAWPTWRIALLATAFSVGIECSQLSDAAWLEELRDNRLAVLVLGRGFAWGDIAAYLIGIAAAGWIEHRFRRLQ